MKRLRALSSSVIEIYHQSNDRFSSFQKSSGLTCPAGCGGCCLSTDISATVLEMLPTALDLFDRQLAEETFDKIELLPEKSSCLFYVKTSSDGQMGYCSNYKLRPSICRSFGAAALINKKGERELSLCKVIKKEKPLYKEQINLAEAPVMGDFVRKILLIDSSIDSKFININQALKEALQKVLTYSSYKDDE